MRVQIGTRVSILAAGIFLAQVAVAQSRTEQSSAGQSPTAVLQIQADHAIANVSPTLYGLMTEEINHSYDGGIYAELIRNRAMQKVSWRGLDDWILQQDGNAEAAMALDTTTGPSTALSRSMKLTVKQADASNLARVRNDGYWGIPLQPQTTYQSSLYAKADKNSNGPVTVSLINNNTGAVVATTQIAALTTEWKPYSFVLKTGAMQASAANHFILSVAQPGTFWFDLISLFPPTYKNTVNGNRIDLMEKLAAMHPAFLRLPGGNYLEGNHISDRLHWKQTLGPLVDRPTHTGPWGYPSSDGLGLLEYLRWCEDLHMQPVLAVYAGYSLAGEHVTPGKDLAPYVQSALDEIEYVTGSVQTKWGAERAKDGHPAPFPLTYVEVGNEDEFDKSSSYDARFAQFFDAIRKADPNLKIIATDPVTSRVPDVIDEHFYKSAEEFLQAAHQYDQTNRKGPKIFVGEWATMEGTPTPDFGAALSDAAWMTGLERNSDIVIMASYAPLLVNVNPQAMQWTPDLIGYDALHSYGSPSYYAQVMFSSNLGTQVVDSSLQNPGTHLYYSVTRDTAKGMLYLKVVNASAQLREMNIQIQGAQTIGINATLTVLRGQSLAETNSIADPERIVPMKTELPNISANFNYTLDPYSIQVLAIPYR